jgi:putative membrane protein
MRIVYLIMVVAFVSLLVAFAFENLANTTVRMFGWTLTAPLAAVIVGVYVLGMMTGGSVVSFIRHSLHQATLASQRNPKSSR